MMLKIQKRNNKNMYKIKLKVLFHNLIKKQLKIIKMQNFKIGVIIININVIEGTLVIDVVLELSNS